LNTYCVLEIRNDGVIKNGAGSRVRTNDLLITNQLLYQLSYAGILSNLLSPTSLFFSWAIPQKTIDVEANWNYFKFNWSGKRGSNSQPTAWKAVALPIELFPHA
jgi:hypothetical protein